MNHLERLVRRALAVPRDRPQGIFDPFDQTTPLLLDAPTPLHVARSTTAPLTVADAPAALPSPAADTGPSAAPAAPVSATAETGAVAAALVPPSPTFATPAPLMLDTPAMAPVPRAAPGSVADSPPLARADAFMRALGARLPDAALAATTSPPPVTRRAVRPAEAVRAVAAPRDSIVAQRSTTTAHPPIPARPNAASAPAAAGGGAPPPPSSPAPAPRASRVAMPERIVERTVVVSSSSTRLDDLAHASRIARFGIGQG